MQVHCSEVVSRNFFPQIISRFLQEIWLCIFYDIGQKHEIQTEDVPIKENTDEENINARLVVISEYDALVSLFDQRELPWKSQFTMLSRRRPI